LCHAGCEVRAELFGRLSARGPFHDRKREIGLTREGSLRLREFIENVLDDRDRRNTYVFKMGGVSDQRRGAGPSLSRGANNGGAVSEFADAVRPKLERPVRLAPSEERYVSNRVADHGADIVRIDAVTSPSVLENADHDAGLYDPRSIVTRAHGRLLRPDPNR
jgi:hypothetical protein